MGTTILLRDVVGETVHRLLVGVGPLDRHIHGDAVVLAGDRNDIRVQGVFQGCQMLHERADTPLVMEVIATTLATFVSKDDFDAGVQERKLAQAPRQDLVMEVGIAVESGH